MKNDLICRQDVLHELDGCDYELKDWQRWKLKTMVRDIPSAEKAQLSGEGTTKDATSDLIRRVEATTIPVMPVEHREYQTMNLDDAYEQGWYDLQKCIEKMPYAEPKRNTGEWITDTYGNVMCSECGWCAPKIMTGCLANRHLDYEKSEFCWHCGAYMRGDTDE